MNILYATDGSQGALVAAPFLNSLPLDQHSHIRLLTVAPEDGTAEGECALLAARKALGGTSAQITLDLRRARRGSTAGQILEAILSASEDQPTDLVIVGTRGFSRVERYLLGSMAERVARYLSCSVLIARPLRGPLDRVILGVDGSPGSNQAAEWLKRFPLPPGCEVRLATIVTPVTAMSSSHFLIPSLMHEAGDLVKHELSEAKQRLESLAGEFAAVGKTAVTEVRTEEATSGLLAVASEPSADLIVVGSQGITGMDRFLLGSVSEKILRHAPCSVLVVRPASETADDDSLLKLDEGKADPVKL